jgi:secreted trypsin-like serine protease
MRAFMLALVLGAVACAPAVPGQENAAIVGGVDETATQDPSVIVIIAQVPGATTATLCTASVVSPHVLLTAAHCLLPSEVGTGAQFFVYTGIDLASATSDDLKADKVQEVHYNADFNPQDIMGGHDVGVVIMTDPIGLTPLIMNRDAITDSDDHQPTRLVGYGQTTAADKTGATAGVRREVTTTLDSHDSNFLHVGEGGMTLCEGDSGGPAFMTLDGTEVIAGITSFGDTGCDSFGTDTRIDKYADSWVQPYLDQFDPGAITPVHHGGGCAIAPGGGGNALGVLLLAGAFLLALRRRSVIA